jgi:hypothetical protein
MGNDRVPAHAPFMFLGVGKHDHEKQSHYDKSLYELLDHGCHSTD